MGGEVRVEVPLWEYVILAHAAPVYCPEVARFHRAVVVPVLVFVQPFGANVADSNPSA
jgi:hypothetical protein